MTARVEDRGDRLIVWNGNAEKRGALTPALYDAIAEAMRLAEEPRIRAVILTSEGRFFCAGGDLNVLIERRKLTEEVRRERVDALHDLVRSIRACPVPVLAAVEGGAAGAGLSLALACDMIVACEDAQFTAAYVKAGLVHGHALCRTGRGEPHLPERSRARRGADAGRHAGRGPARRASHDPGFGRAGL